MSATLVRYCKILGVSPGSSAAQIKQAYRRKAKKIHPDVNPSPGARQQFQQLKAAYEYLLAYKSGNLSPKRASDNSQEANPNKKYGTHKNWNSEANQKAREEARAEAKRKRVEYEQSDEYKEALLFSSFFKYVALAMVIVTVLVTFLSILGIIKVHPLFITFLIITAIPLWYEYVRNSFKHMSFYEFKRLFGHVKTKYRFWIYTMGFTNLFLFFGFTLKTIINTNWIIFGFSILIGISSAVCKFSKFRKNKSTYWSFGILPFMLNLLFLINFTFSGESTFKTHYYKLEPFHGNKTRMNDGFIFLKDGSYKDEYFLRMFFDSETRDNSFITYETASGLFGLNVYKSIEFSSYSENYQDEHKLKD